MVVLCCIHIPQEMGNQGIRIRVSEPSKVKVIVIAQAIAIVNVVYAKILPPLSLRSTAEGHLALIFQVNSIQQPHSASTNQLPQVEMLKSQGFEAFNYKDRQMVGIFDSAVEWWHMVERYSQFQS